MLRREIDASTKHLPLCANPSRSSQLFLVHRHDLLQFSRPSTTTCSCQFPRPSIMIFLCQFSLPSITFLLCQFPRPSIMIFLCQFSRPSIIVPIFSAIRHDFLVPIFSVLHRAQRKTCDLVEPNEREAHNSMAVSLAGLLVCHLTVPTTLQASMAKDKLSPVGSRQYSVCAWVWAILRLLTSIDVCARLGGTRGRRVLR